MCYKNLKHNYLIRLFDSFFFKKEKNSNKFIFIFKLPEDFTLEQKQSLSRVLKKNGILIIQVPFKPGKTYEDLNLSSKNERLEAFGQEDHVRIYGQKSLEEKLKKFEFNVEIIDISKNFSETEKKIYGISEKEIIFKCLK